MFACGGPATNVIREGPSITGFPVSAWLLSTFLCLVAVSRGPIARWMLPRELNEISGLALTSDGRLLAHGDELGTIFEIDYRRGAVVKQFQIGKRPVAADFEAIAVAHDTIVLLASDGTLYSLREGANGGRMDYTVRDLKLGRECEFEGLAFDPAINSLLLACKTVGAKDLRQSLVIFRWKLEREGGPRLSRLTVPLSRVIGSNGWSGLHPSDITIDPLTGNYVLVAAREQAIVVITPRGEVVGARPLPAGHPQAEGVAIANDSILIISDEKGLGPAAMVTLYRWPLSDLRRPASRGAR